MDLKNIFETFKPHLKKLVILNDAIKSARAGLREQEVRRTGISRAERRPVVQAKRSGGKLLASN
jgi:hypothetical protein